MQNDEVIATCTSLLNSTAGKCTNATDSSSSTISGLVCWIHDCPQEEGEAIFPHSLFIILGVLCYVLQCYLSFCANRNDASGRNDASKSKKYNASDLPSSLHDIGPYFNIGTYLLILVSAMKSLEHTIVWAFVFAVPFHYIWIDAVPPKPEMQI